MRGGSNRLFQSLPPRRRYRTPWPPPGVSPAFCLLCTTARHPSCPGQCMLCNQTHTLQGDQARSGSAAAATERQLPGQPTLKHCVASPMQEAPSMLCHTCCVCLLLPNERKLQAHSPSCMRAGTRSAESSKGRQNERSRELAGYRQLAVDWLVRFGCKGRAAGTCAEPAMLESAEKRARERRGGGRRRTKTCKGRPARLEAASSVGLCVCRYNIFWV